jgi:hypothetical protein
MNRWRVGEDWGSKETDGCPLTESITENEWEEADDKNENENLAQGKDNDSWVDKVAALSPDDCKEREVMIQPVKLVLVNVSHQYTFEIAVFELTQIQL